MEINFSYVTKRKRLSGALFLFSVVSTQYSVMLILITVKNLMSCKA